MSRLALVSLAASLLIAPLAAHAAESKPIPTRTPPRTARAVFAMGCFWCAETDFEEQPGVLAVVSGYTGGKEQNPTYEQVSNHQTGHYESIEITYDPSQTTYAKLLDLFWHSIDPTQGDGQFCDRGHQYQSVVFAVNADQRREAEASKAALEASHVLKKPIVTQILPASRFWPAEDYHQDFWKKDPVRYRSYRLACGRDARLAQLWGKAVGKPLVH